MNEKIIQGVVITVFVVYHLSILTLAIMTGVNGGFLIGLKVFGCCHAMGAPITLLSLCGLGIYIAEKLGYIELDD